MLYQPMCAMHNVELEQLAQPVTSLQIVDYFACPLEVANDRFCVTFWHFKPVTVDPNLPEIVRNAIAELRGATNRLNNGIMHTSRRD